MECKRLSPWLSLTLNVVMHVAILMAILTIFFDLVISKTIKTAFSEEINNAISENLPGALDKANVSSNGQACTALKSVSKPNGPVDKLKEYYKEPSAEVTNNNRYVTDTALGLSVSMAIMFCIIYTLLRISCGYCMTLPTLLLENFIIFIFVGAVEYFFFMEVATKYVPVAPSLLVESFINNLKESV